MPGTKPPAKKTAAEMRGSTTASKGLRACVPDLAGEDGVPGAELTGCVLEAELAREGEEPPDALLAIDASVG